MCWPCAQNSGGRKCHVGTVRPGGLPKFRRAALAGRFDVGISSTRNLRATANHFYWRLHPAFRHERRILLDRRCQTGNAAQSARKRKATPPCGVGKSSATQRRQLPHIVRKLWLPRHSSAARASNADDLRSPSSFRQSVCRADLTAVDPRARPSSTIRHTGIEQFRELHLRRAFARCAGLSLTLSSTTPAGVRPCKGKPPGIFLKNPAGEFASPVRGGTVWERSGRTRTT